MILNCRKSFSWWNSTILYLSRIDTHIHTFVLPQTLFQADFFVIWPALLADLSFLSPDLLFPQLPRLRSPLYALASHFTLLPMSTIILKHFFLFNFFLYLAVSSDPVLFFFSSWIIIVISQLIYSTTLPLNILAYLS